MVWERCLLCGDPEHRAASRIARVHRGQRETLEFLGHVIDGGFFFVDMGDEEIVLPQHLAKISVIQDHEATLPFEVTVDIIRAELEHLDGSAVDTSPTYR
jgi:hypothetical protein